MCEKDREILQLLRENATRHLASAMGIEVIALTAERVVDETIASIGGAMNVDLDQFTAVGLEINANHIRAKKVGVVTGIGTPLHVGRSTQVWKGRIMDEAGRAVCLSCCTRAVVPRLAGSSVDSLL